MAELQGHGRCSVYWQLIPGDLIGETSIHKLDMLIKAQKAKAMEFYNMVTIYLIIFVKLFYLVMIKTAQGSLTLINVMPTML